MAGCGCREYEWMAVRVELRITISPERTTCVTIKCILCSFPNLLIYTTCPFIDSKRMVWLLFSGERVGGRLEMVAEGRE